MDDDEVIYEDDKKFSGLLTDEECRTEKQLT